MRRSGRKRPRACRDGGVVDVGVACIHLAGQYLIAQRSKKKGGKWEFPGGKREVGESIRSCVRREVCEELGLRVQVSPPFLVAIRRGVKAKWRLHFCSCRIKSGHPVSREHQRLKWVTAAELLKHPFPAANREAVYLLYDSYGSRKRRSR